MSAGTLITKCTPHQKYDQWKGGARTSVLFGISYQHWTVLVDTWGATKEKFKARWSNMGSISRGTATVLSLLLGWWKCFLFFFFIFFKFISSFMFVLFDWCFLFFCWFVFFFLGVFLVFFFLSFILMRTQCLKLRGKKKKRPVKILESLLLWLRSTEKANCCFFISFCFCTCKLPYATPHVAYCMCPFPATLLIPAPLCSSVSSDARHRKSGSLAVSLRNTNERVPCPLTPRCLCVQHLEILGSQGRIPAPWSKAAERMPSPAAPCRKGLFCVFL